METGRIVAVHRDSRHRFTKETVDRITLLEGLGVEGDAHAGVTVQHLSRVRRDPTQPNLRQVHLIHAELLDELAARGYDVAAGNLGENVTTRGLDLLALPTGAVLHLGDSATVRMTGLRNPCVQIENFGTGRQRSGLLKQVLRNAPDGSPVRLAGVMGVVTAGGQIAPGDAIRVVLPSGDPIPLLPV
jgi:MOSC domain-containing protein YiiM